MSDKVIASPWKKTLPPMDGTWIIAIGAIIWKDEFSTTCEPFLALVHWTDRQGESSGWHLRSGLSLRETLDDVVRIDFWLEEPT